MSKNYQKVCWQCGHEGLNDMGSYYWCPLCQATYNDLPKPGHYPITMKHNDCLGMPSASPSMVGKHHQNVASEEN